MTQVNGVDFSHFQGGAVDFAKLKAGGCEFVFLKATDGVSFIDPFFKTNRAKAKAAGIPCGAYHFFRSQQSVTTQANHFLDVVGPLEPGDLFPVLDVENDAQFAGIAPKHAADMVVAWMQQVESKFGVPCILYGGRSIVTNVLASDVRLAQLGRILWYPLYQSRNQIPPPPRPFKVLSIWQFSQTGAEPGVPGHVDQNISFVPVSDFTKK
jgi:lysozyme